MPDEIGYGGAGDHRVGGAGLAARLRRHADALERGRRSPLYVELMRGAADSAEAGGIVAAIFDGDPLEPGSVPALRLMAVLHRLVLSGDAPELARHVDGPGTAGERGDPPQRERPALGPAPTGAAWAAAERTLAAHVDVARAEVSRAVQTNEPGRCTALYGALLWLAELHRLPVRLLEIGASAGLNLNPDRYGYVVGAATIGDAASELQFVEPWIGAPVAAPAAAQGALRIVERAGCDPRPIDATTPAGRRRALSYIWPDEPDRMRRVAQAIAIATRNPVAVQSAPASAWLRTRLARPRPGVLTVVWQSVVHQYLADEERHSIAREIAAAPAPIAWLTFEPGADHVDGFELRCRRKPGGDTLLARCGDHGPPVRWRADATPNARDL